MQRSHSRRPSSLSLPRPSKHHPSSRLPFQSQLELSATIAVSSPLPAVSIEARPSIPAQAPTVKILFFPIAKELSYILKVLVQRAESQKHLFLRGLNLVRSSKTEGRAVAPFSFQKSCEIDASERRSASTLPKLLRVRSNIKAVMVLTEGSWLRTSSKVVVLGNQSSESYRFIRKNTHASIKKQKTVKEEIEKEKAHKKCIKNERWSVFSKASKGQQKGTRQAPAMAAQIVEERLQGRGSCPRRYSGRKCRGWAKECA